MNLPPLKQKTLPQVFDELWDRAIAYNNKYIHCGWENGKCKGLADGCCNGCKYLSADGCTVKSLWCKVWDCGMINVAREPQDEKRAILIDYRFYNFAEGRKSKQDALEEAIWYMLRKPYPRSKFII